MMGQGQGQMGQGQMGRGMAGACPMQVTGTKVDAENIEGGVALEFTTTGDVDTLRQHVASMAEMHNRHHGQGMAPTEQQAGGRRMPMSTATSKEVDNGARILLTARNQADVARLRQFVRRMADHMAAAGSCPMMRGMQASPSAKLD